MWKIEFYLLPSQSYQRISLDEAIAFDENVIHVKETDSVVVPGEFYEIADEQGINAISYFYENDATDISTYLLEIISKQKHCDETYRTIQDKEVKGYLALTKTDTALEDRELIVYQTKEEYNYGVVKISDVIKVKRRYLRLSKNYDSFQKQVEYCFPSLIFHKDAFRNMKKMGKFSDVVEELSRHLMALNDYGKRIYEECEGDEEKALNHLRSTCKITCSGKGSNENLKFKQNMFVHGKEYKITCNAHTKFYEGYNDQRIYFSWGRKEIQNHKLIIIRIGVHWEK